jgi:hypothetical protein
MWLDVCIRIGETLIAGYELLDQDLNNLKAQLDSNTLLKHEYEL